MDRPAENQILATPTVSRPPSRSRRAVRQLRIGHQAIGSSAVGAQVSGSLAIGAVALGAIAVGALALGALAIGRLVIGRASVRETHLAGYGKTTCGAHRCPHWGWVLAWPAHWIGLPSRGRGPWMVGARAHVGSATSRRSRTKL
jgi:hypothetical protein